MHSTSLVVLLTADLILETAYPAVKFGSLGIKATVGVNREGVSFRSGS